MILIYSLLASCSSTKTKENINSVLDYDTPTFSPEKEVVIAKIPPPPKKTKQEFFSSSTKKANVKSNLSGKWLEVEGYSNKKVWLGVQSFLVTMGFSIKEERRNIGFIKTDFIAHKEIVPLDIQEPLTRALNSWRPELAEGGYDRLVARVEFDKEKKLSRVYFYHYMIEENAGADDELPTGDWKNKPFNPMFEAEVLYQAAIFFGSNKKTALQQVAMSALLIEDENGDRELSKIRFKAGKEKSWDYFMAMIYRAGWFIEEAKKTHFTAKVSLPKKTKLLSHKQVIFKIKSKKQNGQTYSYLSVDSVNDTPLSVSERKYLFQYLGLL